MPGIINAHRMRIRKFAKFVRLTHLQQNAGSLYLSDLDTEENKRTEHKIPVYIPYGDTVDILLTDRVLTAWQQGSIRVHIEQGRLEGYLVTNVEVDEVGDLTLPTYNLEIDDDFLPLDTSGGDIMIELPEIIPVSNDPAAPIPEGTEVTIKKTTADANQIIITAFAGDLIEGSLASYTINTHLDFVTLQSDGLGNWWVKAQGFASGTTNVGTPRRDLIFVTNPATLVYNLSFAPSVNTDSIYLNGQKLVGAGNDYTLIGNTVTFNLAGELFIGDVLEFQYFSP